MIEGYINRYEKLTMMIYTEQRERERWAHAIIYLLYNDDKLLIINAFIIVY